MACYKPLNAWQSEAKNPETGKSYLIFKAPRHGRKGYNYVQLPCGRCIGCRLERSRQWAIRCMHEAQMHTQNSFITLTFDDDHIHFRHSLVKADFQKFMKRLRKLYQPKTIRFLHAGEYGEKTDRPHHHAIIFNHDFEDKKIHRKYMKGGTQYTAYTSETLRKLWPFGIHEIGEVTFESAAYVARYCCKKQNGKQKLLLPRLSSRIDRKTKEYITMSRRPGIGTSWLKKYGESDVWNNDQVVVRGQRMKPPKFYTNTYELTNPLEHGILKEIRLKKAKDNPDNHWDRLPAREKVQLERFKQLTRSL